jgi:AcrR family transcriptional regulator
MYAEVAKTQLSRETIVEGAIELIEAEGIGALTMRALAERLGASPMGLYRHVETKQELLGAIADHYLSEVDLPRTDELDWRETITQVSAALHEAFLAHPDLSEILAVQHIDTITMFRATNVILDALTDAGLSGPEAVQALDVITNYAAGFTQRKAELRRRATAKEGRMHRLGELPEDEFATVRELSGELVDLDFQHGFEDGLALILDGIEARIVARK